MELDEKHAVRQEVGYIFIENGKIMVKALVYPNDVFRSNGKNITELMTTTPRELSESEIETLRSALEKMGLDLIS